MFLLHMRPEEIKATAAKGLPVLLPVGAVEYHGEHMPVGTDTLIAEGLCKMVAERAEAVVAPAIAFSPTMHWAGGADSGDMDFSEAVMSDYALEYIRRLVAAGFTRVYVILGHQGKGGLPSVIMQRAGLSAAAEISRTMDGGWGARPPEQWPFANIFSVVRVCDYDEFVDYGRINKTERMPVGHGGRGETQLIMALHDGLVRMDALERAPKPPPFWLDDVYQADAADGAFWLEQCAEGFAAHLNG